MIRLEFYGAWRPGRAKPRRGAFPFVEHAVQASHGIWLSFESARHPRRASASSCRARNPPKLALHPPLGMPEVISSTHPHPQPQSRPVAAELPESHGHLGSHRHLAGEDTVQRLTAHSKLAGGVRHARIERRQDHFTQQYARVARATVRLFDDDVFAHKRLSVILLRIHSPSMLIPRRSVSSPIATRLAGFGGCSQKQTST